MYENYRAEMIYIAENDAHFAELSIADTLSFAIQATHSDQSTKGNSAEQPLQNLVSSFDLHNARNVRIGNEVLKGSSGGEKRRVTIAEAVANEPSLQYWDNSTRGLDSTTALRTIRFLRRTADIDRSTAVVILYQASQQILDLAGTAGRCCIVLDVRTLPLTIHERVSGFAEYLLGASLVLCRCGMGVYRFQCACDFCDLSLRSSAMIGGAMA